MRKAGIALSAFALALTLGACGDDGGSGGSSSNNNSGGDAGGGSVAAASLADLAKSIGEQTAETDTAHMTMSMNAAGQEMSGEGDVRMSEQDPAMSLDMTTPEGTVSVVLVDNIFYVKLPQGQELEPGKSWLKIDPTDESNPMAQGLGSMTEQMSKNADPRATLEQFEKAGEITDSKEEELNGKQTTHYTITVDVEKLAANQEDPTMKSAMDQAIEAGLKDFPVDAWIDEEDLPVRFTMEMPTPNPASGKTETVSMQIDYTDWGKSVDISAPPADQIAEFPGS